MASHIAPSPFPLHPFRFIIQLIFLSVDWEFCVVFKASFKNPRIINKVI